MYTVINIIFAFNYQLIHDNRVCVCVFVCEREGLLRGYQKDPTPITRRSLEVMR